MYHFLISISLIFSNNWYMTRWNIILDGLLCFLLNKIKTGIPKWTSVLFLFSTFCLKTKGGAKNSRLLLFGLKNSHRAAYFRNLPSLWLRLRTAGSRLRPISNFSSRQKSKGRKCPCEDITFCKSLKLDSVFLRFFSALNWYDFLIWSIFQFTLA